MNTDVTDNPEVPRHVAIIMDGNGRWAQRRGLPRHMGHRAGVKAARAVIEACGERGVRVLTLFAFSSENWLRPREEVARLMELFMNALDEELDELDERGVRLGFIGDRSGFPPALRQRMQAAETRTADNEALTLMIAVGYGGRWDIVAAARALAHRSARGELDPAAIDETVFAAALSLAGLPDPDLLIRTGGEQRISNFLLWQLAYSELYFTDVLWPDFGARELEAVFEWYSRRERRFGRTPEQLGGRNGA